MRWNHDKSTHHTDQKPSEWPNTQSAGSKKAPLHFYFSQVCQKSGGEEATECFWFCRNMEGKLADRTSLCATRFDTAFDGRTLPSHLEHNFFNLIFLKEKKASSSIGTKMLPGYALNFKRRLDRRLDLIIADWHDIENNVGKRGTTAGQSGPSAGNRAVPTAGRENREGRLAASIR